MAFLLCRVFEADGEGATKAGSGEGKLEEDAARAVSGDDSDAAGEKMLAQSEAGDAILGLWLLRLELKYAQYAVSHEANACVELQEPCHSSAGSRA